MEALELIVNEGRPANAGRFFQLGADLLALLDELSLVPVPWRVEDLRSGSAVARVVPPEPGSKEGRWLRLAVASLDAVQAGAGLSDDDWSPDAIKVAHRFIEHGQPTDDNEDWVAPRLVLVGSANEPDRSVPLTAELGRRLADLQPFERRMPGSVRGTLVGLNVSRGNRASLRTRFKHANSGSPLITPMRAEASRRALRILSGLPMVRLQVLRGRGGPREGRVQSEEVGPARVRRD